jgi:hypothetical protein
MAGIRRHIGMAEIQRDLAREDHVQGDWRH